MISGAFLLIAILYAAVGHGGASGYLAVMALAGFEPEAMKPTALTLNLVVSLIGTIMFLCAGHFVWGLFWRFAVMSIPFAFLGGGVHLGIREFNLLVAFALGFAALRLLVPASAEREGDVPPFWAVVVSGAAIGLVSGLIGVGGGIFLTPLLLLFGWAETKAAAAVSAPFIFVNSAAGLVGHSSSLHHLSGAWPWWVFVVIVGGLIGGRWGSQVARPACLRSALVIVLVVATAKLLIA